MLKIIKGNPWVMWPDSLVENFIPDPANKILDYNGDFDFKIIFELPNLVKTKSTLFSKLPSYFGIDIEQYGLTSIITEIKGNSKYEFGNFTWESDKKYDLKVKKRGSSLMVLIDNILIIEHIIETDLASDDISHIIFGSGNFPKNNFNLNYVDITLHELEIKKEETIMCLHKFETFIHNKCFDETGNCNFIHKI